MHKVLLNKGKNGNSMVITHERWSLTSFLCLDSLKLILVNFPQILELGIINYGLIINYQGLTIKQ
jgi:hypothetical protein